jgi:hypothetical protein
MARGCKDALHLLSAFIVPTEDKMADFDAQIQESQKQVAAAQAKIS